MILIRKWAPLFVIAILLTTNGFAQTKYITDDMTLTFRSGPSNEHKILSFLKSGQRLELLQAGEKWSKVKLPDGREGWVLSHYLSDQPASRDMLERLQAKHQVLTDQAAKLMEENEQLAEENKKLMAAVADHEKALETLRADFETLQSESAEFIALKKKYDEATASLQDRNSRLVTLEEQVGSMELNYTIKWFLAGSGVLVLGIIIGFISRRPRRRSSLL